MDFAAEIWQKLFCTRCFVTGSVPRSSDRWQRADDCAAALVPGRQLDPNSGVEPLDLVHGAGPLAATNSSQGASPSLIRWRSLRATV